MNNERPKRHHLELDIAELKRQRDELFEALRPFADVDLRTQGVHHNFASQVLQARAAIAKVKGSMS